MARRDRAERGGRRGQRAARRSHAPTFLDSDADMEDDGDDELGLASMKARTRKQYDERRDADDLDGVEDVSLLTGLHLDLANLLCIPGNPARATERHQSEVHR